MKEIVKRFNRNKYELHKQTIVHNDVQRKVFDVISDVSNSNVRWLIKYNIIQIINKRNLVGLYGK